jgi:hypothetical protein
MLALHFYADIGQIALNGKTLSPSVSLFDISMNVCAICQLKTLIVVQLLRKFNVFN